VEKGATYRRKQKEESNGLHPEISFGPRAKGGPAKKESGRRRSSDELENDPRRKGEGKSTA